MNARRFTCFDKSFTIQRSPGIAKSLERFGNGNADFTTKVVEIGKEKLNKQAMVFMAGEGIGQEFFLRFGLPVWLFFSGPNAWTHYECRFPATGVFCL